MSTKKELQSEIKSLKKENSGLRNLKYEYAQEVDKLKGQMNALQSNKQNAVAGLNMRADLLRQIREILVGEAKPISKFEVIRDLFLEEIKMIEEHTGGKNSFISHRDFLTEPYMEKF